MRYVALSLTIVLVIGLLACGCLSKPAPAPQTPTPTPDFTPVATTPTAIPFPSQLGGQWVLQTMMIQDGSVPLTPTTQITFTLNPDGSATGYDGCNNYFTSFTLTGQPLAKGSGIVFGPITTSKKSCPMLASQEQTYLSILGKSSAYVVNGNLLTLTDPTQNALVYQQASSITPTPYSVPFPA